MSSSSSSSTPARIPAATLREILCCGVDYIVYIFPSPRLLPVVATRRSATLFSAKTLHCKNARLMHGHAPLQLRIGDIVLVRYAYALSAGTPAGPICSSEMSAELRPLRDSTSANIARISRWKRLRFWQGFHSLRRDYGPTDTRTTQRSERRPFFDGCRHSG